MSQPGSLMKSETMNTSDRRRIPSAAALSIGARSVMGARSSGSSASRSLTRRRTWLRPPPGGIVRSGSKVGSKYKKLKASTNDAYCPTLRAVVQSELPSSAGAVYEIVIDGLSQEAVRAAMRAGLHAACKTPGVVRVTAGNYGGKLGPFHFYLRELLD